MDQPSDEYNLYETQTGINQADPKTFSRAHTDQFSRTRKKCVSLRNALHVYTPPQIEIITSTTDMENVINRVPGDARASRKSNDELIGNGGRAIRREISGEKRRRRRRDVQHHLFFAHGRNSGKGAGVKPLKKSE